MTSPADDDIWKKTLLPAGATVQDAIRNLNASAAKIVLLVGHDGLLAGTVTDGDIRRGLLRGLTLESLVSPIARPDPVVVPPDVSRDMVLRLMQMNLLDAIPVVDTDRRVVGLHLLNELLTPRVRPNPMVIMAGGRGTRLWPHTEHCPKPLLPVGGKPMLEHILERARDEGFHHFVLALHYRGDMIRAHFGDGSAWKVRIEYLNEDSPLGTAGALGLLDPVPAMPVLVSNADVLTDIRYGEMLDFHVRHAAAATMAVRLHELQHPFGVVHTKGVDIVGFEEKPVARSHINAGIYVIEPSALHDLQPPRPMDMPALFSGLHARGQRTIVYPMHEPWLDVGKLGDYDEANGSIPSRQR
jgi:dTDP-glucose pyrophosphorylase